MPTEAAPIIVTASGNFQGNDGSWSTLNISVGTPPQYAQVIASTETPETWVVGVNGCLSMDPSNCTVNRGGTFDKIKSSSWITKAPYLLEAESNLGYTSNNDTGGYGFDTIGIGKPGAGNVSVDGQVVAEVLTKDFYVGTLGLASRPMIFGSDNDPHPSLISSLQNRSLIPSLAYGFAAGASYRNADTSLTLGGYDASRFIPNDVSFSFGPQSTRQLVVGLKAISYSDAKKTDSPLLQTGILTLLDSLTPQIWLPLDACQLFEKAFGIVYDPIPNLYLINQTVHDQLLQQNASVTFELSNTLNGGPSVQIILPYASFDLEIGPPFTKSVSKYFPLRRAADGNQYTLGRTFLQEAYLIVNYETLNFSVSQSTYSQSTPPHIVPIPATNSTAESAPPTTSPGQPQVSVSTGHGSQSLGIGAIAGIVVALVGITLICGAVIFYCRPSRRRRRKSVEAPAYIITPKDAFEVQGSHFSNTTAKDKIVDIIQEEKDSPMTPPDERSGYELDAGRALPSELGSPIPELPSPGHEPPTFELASPETVPRRIAPDPSPIAPSITAIRSSYRNEWNQSGTPSPESEFTSAPSPDSAAASPSIKRISRRPTYPRQDSLGAEPVLSSAARPATRPAANPVQPRGDSMYFESGRTPDAMQSSPLPNRTGSSNFGQWSGTSTGRSMHGRVQSKDSIDSFDTRLEHGSPSGTYSGTPRVQASPSPLQEYHSHEELRSAMSSPELGSEKSGLMSPPPLLKRFEDS